VIRREVTMGITPAPITPGTISSTVTRGRRRRRRQSMMQGINSWQGTILSCQEVEEKAEDGSSQDDRKSHSTAPCGVEEKAEDGSICW
jgi:hypothetical protein